MSGKFSSFYVTINISFLVKLWMGNGGVWEDGRPAYHDWASKKISEYLHDYQQHFTSSNTVIVTETEQNTPSLLYSKLN